MNATRRVTGQLIIALLLECNESGMISDENHLVATGALKHMLDEEGWQLRAQEKYEGKNESTDKQIAICRLATPALSAAVDAWNNDDYDTVMAKVRFAIETDGTPPKPARQARAKRKTKSRV